MKIYKVYLKEVHWQEVVVEAESRPDAIRRAIDGEGKYRDRTNYESTFDDESEHRVEEHVTR